MNLSFSIYIWLVAWVLIVVAAIINCKRLKRNPPNQETIIVSGFALASAIALAKVLYKVLVDQELQTALDFDGSVAICISSLLGIYLSLKELTKLF